MSPLLLCIEDHADTRELLAEALSDRGFQVVTAADGVSGLEQLRQLRPDLVICDILMPGLSGFDVLEKLSERPDDELAMIPFVFLTALDDRETILRGRRLGADDYVTKPVDFEILAEIIKRRLAPPGRTAPQPALTPREREIMTWVARGKSSTDIAVLLGLSDRTVDFHVENVIRKLGVATRTQAAIQACLARMIRL